MKLPPGKVGFWYTSQPGQKVRFTIGGTAPH
jgi:hypothetical protein